MVALLHNDEKELNEQEEFFLALSISLTQTFLSVLFLRGHTIGDEHEGKEGNRDMYLLASVCWSWSSGVSVRGKRNGAQGRVRWN